MPDYEFINTAVCPGESSCQAQEADGAERKRKESEKLALFLAPPASGLGFPPFLSLCFSVRLCIYTRSFFHLRRGLRTSLEMEPGVGALMVRQLMSQRWLLSAWDLFCLLPVCLLVSCLIFVFCFFFSLRYLLLQVSRYDIPNSQEAMLASAPAQKKRKFSEPKERFWPHTASLRRFQSGL